MEKIIALDIGISSIGFALVEYDGAENGKIIDSGVRLFTAAEEPKTKESLALPRREARGSRRIVERRARRKNKIKGFLAKALGINFDEFAQDSHISPFFSEKLESVWNLRVKALNEKLEPKELARVLIHIAKRRGYKDNSKVLDLKDNKKMKDEEAKDKEEGRVLESIKTVNNLMTNKSYRTFGEMVYRESIAEASAKNEHKDLDKLQKMNENFAQFRNRQKVAKDKDGKEIIEASYKYVATRGLLEEEARAIIKAQNGFGYKLDADKYCDMAFSQRPLKSFSHLVGTCVLAEINKGKLPQGEKRAGKNTPSAEEFIALTKIINTILNLNKVNSNLGLVADEATIIKILNKAKEAKKVTYTHLREILALPYSIRFGYPIKYETKDKKTPEANMKKDEAKEFLELKSYHKLKDALVENFAKLNVATLDDIATKITLTKDKNKLQKELENKKELNKQDIENLTKLSFSSHINIGLSALNLILPFMRNGKKYDEACTLAGLQFTKQYDGEKSEFLPPLELSYKDSITNPVVKRALSQVRKVVNALIKKHGSVHKIHIELTRDIGKSAKERDEIKKKQDKNRKENETAIAKLTEIGMDINGKNILKAKLWLRQDEFCPYSGTKITIDNLKAENELEIDHIYPLSRSLDDSQSNQALVKIKANQEKGNRTPAEWKKSIDSTNDAFMEYCKFIKSLTKLPKNVQNRLVNENFKDKDVGFLERNLNDTSYIARLTAEYIKENLKFLPLENEKSQHLFTRNGSMTAMLRHYFGLEGKNRGNHLHHAEDAIILAFITQSNVQNITNYLKNKETQYVKAENKAKMLESNTGKKNKPRITLPFPDFREDVLESVARIFVSHTPRRSISGAMHKETIISKNDDDLQKVYGGEKGLQRAIDLGKVREIRGGIVSNGEMPRVDIFQHKTSKKFYIVPIYTIDFAKNKLPNKAIVIGKDTKTGIIKDWLEMDDNYKFCFSLWKGDLVEIQKSEKDKVERGYYVSTGVSTGSIDLKSHDGKTDNFFKKDGLALSVGVQNLHLFKRLEVSVLGEVKEATYKEREGV